MAEDITSRVSTIHKVRPNRKDKTGAGRAKAYRHRKGRQAKVAPAVRAKPPSEEYLIPPEFLAADGTIADPSTPAPVALVDQEEGIERLPAMIVQQKAKPTTSKRYILAPAFVTVPILAFAAVGISINGWLVRSLADQAKPGRRRGR